MYSRSRCCPPIDNSIRAG